MVRIWTGLVWVRMRRRSREGRDCWCGDVEGVLGVAGGVVGGEVEGFEVVEVGFDLGAEVGAVAEMVEDGDDLVHGLRSGWGMPGARMVPGRVMSIPCTAACFGRGGGFEGGFDLLLELVEADAEGFFGFGWGGFEPGFADELETALFAAEPVEAEGFDVGGVGGADLFGESGEGWLEGGFVEGRELRDGFVHA